MPDGYRSIARPNGLSRFSIGPISDDGSQQPTRSSNITSLSFVESHVANKIVFPDDPTTYDLNYNSLKDVEALGHGKFGIEKEMAVKRIRILHNMTDPSSAKTMQRFKKEVETCKNASNCDEIVKFFGITFYQADAFMCMELMDLSLDKLYLISHNVAQSPFQEACLGSVAVATINALEHLKTEHRIIHRDIKPSNILLDRNGFIKLCDFGICGYLQNSVAQSVDAGCRPYMAPERIRPDGDGYDIKSDVWSLGLSMVEVANGAYPYQGFTNSPLFQQVQLVVLGDPPLLRADHFSNDMTFFIAQCTIKDKSIRADLKTLKDTEVYKTYNTNLHRPTVGRFVYDMYCLRNHLDM
ncbi:unnamed protein product [Caenorhabditis angaria]|uniref:mitogen-activated protein kinase kinase n=1 Tax=Caenorhabditis angaria TaxID=860376 RepID=A0A9P1N8W8_9PELO|nr:unnamed protein product [Caenorhabditis angaria]